MEGRIPPSGSVPDTVELAAFGEAELFQPDGRLVGIVALIEF